MTISTTASRASYAGNGTTDEFAFPYYFLNDDDLSVIIRDSDGNETEKTLVTDYTIAGSGESTGGTVTMNTPPASGETVIIYRDPEIIQESDWVENDNDPAEVKEQAFDRLTMISQRLSDRVDRAIRLTDGFADAFDAFLPSILEANMFLRINPSGNGWVLSSGIAGGAEDVTVTPSGNISSTNVQSALEELQGDINSLHAVTSTFGSPTSVTALGGITPAGKFDETLFLKGSSGAVDISANPQIAAGTILGQRLTLVGCSDTDTLKLEHGTGLIMNGPCTLKAGSIIKLIWIGSNWAEVARNDL